MTDFVEAKPMWFKVVAVVLVLWGLIGLYFFWAQILRDPPMLDDWTRDYMARQPKWTVWVYAIAVLSGAIGSVALLMGSRIARPIYIVSLIAVVVQFGHALLMTELVAVKGAAMTVPFPLFIAAVALFQIWLAGTALRKGWIA